MPDSLTFISCALSRFLVASRLASKHEINVSSAHFHSITAPVQSVETHPITAPVATRRIWTEFLDPEELASPPVIQLLQRYRLQPLIALPESRETPAMAQALRALHKAGVPIGLWPLLSDADGYWASSENVAEFIFRVNSALSFATRIGVPIQTIVIDLEPPEKLKRELMHSRFSTKASILLSRHRRAQVPAIQRRFEHAVRCYSRLAIDLQVSGIETLAIAVPPVLVDIAAQSETWQQLFATPVTGPSWSTLSPMMYSSMIRSALPQRLKSLSPVLLAEACSRMQQSAYSESMCLSLGVVGRGKMQDEVSYSSAGELARDVSIANAAGIGDMALFSLEGILATGNPDDWLQVFCCDRSNKGLGSIRNRFWRQAIEIAIDIAVHLASRPVKRRTL